MQIDTVYDVYTFVETLKSAARESGAKRLCGELDAASRLGSSALEILGAIRGILIKNHETIDRLLGTGGTKASEEVIAFVDKAFGR